MVSVESIESILSKIPGVQAARVVMEEDQIVEIHIVSDDEKSPKQLVRDIETVLYASLGLKIDRKVISIAQVDLGIESSKVVPYKLTNFEVEEDKRNIKVKVEITHGQEMYVGEFSGPKTTKNIPLVIGNAVLRALESVHDFAISMDDAVELKIAGKEFVVSHISKMYNQKEESIIGAAELKKNKYEAIAESVLDAFRRV
ncbi:hypothetical protein SU69_01480 [Thermosipho melanesiensis]|uniref:Uncharacterized protein n=2 Tax=Thermosipho melanesiensis TaxID=46541 RepID=A6LJQ2_THEM4|nr:hypothetical protein [Thermosipho melanesiensis]ABR30153.1 hypothetical protein Tmel_0281 [Thermosipho melanesiensis BI429]APT73352.1 hypothetical protein BW47_01535 [Thermosipho melanesiensis]OOC38167.1 hypothetical protein SU68_01485 [Thermosipho melanesiensis]OOC40088.1 hypothetical protein SU70_01480 [Thermosipho melanesiensis]OOC40141.1 hypothetical protein SU69_01480 [Thermosipho melanesiensis]